MNCRKVHEDWKRFVDDPNNNLCKPKVELAFNPKYYKTTKCRDKKILKKKPTKKSSKSMKFVLDSPKPGTLKIPTSKNKIQSSLKKVLDSLENVNLSKIDLCIEKTVEFHYNDFKFVKTEDLLNIIQEIHEEKRLNGEDTKIMLKQLGIEELNGEGKLENSTLKNRFGSKRFTVFLQATVARLCQERKNAFEKAGEQN